MSEGRRVRLLTIGDGFLPMVFGGGDHHYSVVRDGLPADARVVGCRHWDWRLELLIESESFDVVPDGQPIPAIEPIFLSLRPPEIEPGA
jgi:hypothetical protein